jgi:hypothetical protein
MMTAYSGRELKERKTEEEEGFKDWRKSICQENLTLSLNFRYLNIWVELHGGFEKTAPD